MTITLRLSEITETDRGQVGGKAFALAEAIRRGIRVPGGLCVCADAYREFFASTGLRERISLELGRKRFEDMRWEEMWDASLRIRNMFLNAQMPDGLQRELLSAVSQTVDDRPVAVRSSALGEDAAGASFAGLHESYVNVRGADRIVEHIKLVWASLWSDAALLYRQELGLDVTTSAMAVVVQELVAGERSGVAFCQSPNDETQSVIEAVHGLNQGLVDGTVEPDRWVLDRGSGAIISHTPAVRENAILQSEDGVELRALPSSVAQAPPLAEPDVADVYGLARRAEQTFGPPQDVEWTFRGEDLYLLQSRPITTSSGTDQEDKRSWYLSLRRSFDNLKALRARIEGELIPGMVVEAERLAAQDVSDLDDAALTDEIERRAAIHEKWTEVYWNDFIPFAHGARLFGQVYNDAIRPEDPYEFVDLLAGGAMVSVARNAKLEALADEVRGDEALAAALESGQLGDQTEFAGKLDEFLQSFGEPTLMAGAVDEQRRSVAKLVLEMARARKPAGIRTAGHVDGLAERFISHFEADKRGWAEELLDLGRASHRLRDDDNIYLGRIEAQLEIAVGEGRRRLRAMGVSNYRVCGARELMRALREPGYVPQVMPEGERAAQVEGFKARQLVGQPAGSGIARGLARVILGTEDLFAFKKGEILICDAVDPNMTFVVPLCAGIVERRGGMLIHGAIIAREYGLPCVTGVPQVADLVETGDQITVDGYLGIVTIGRTAQYGEQPVS